MNRKGNFDQLLRAWMDDGADVAPERFVQAAIDQAELTAQRGSWRVSLEGMIMRLQPAAPILGIAAIAIAAIALYAAFAGQNTGTPTPTPRVVTPDALSSIVVTDANAPDGLLVDGTVTGAQALVYGLPPGGPAIDQAGFLDAEVTTLSTSAGDPALSTWAAVFKTADDAQAAYAYVAARHEAADGWGLEPIDGSSSLGDESVAYRGPAYGYDEAGIYLWRVNDVVLAAIGVGGTDDAALLEVAQGMDARAH
jgi:hypothetical protein